MGFQAHDGALVMRGWPIEPQAAKAYALANFLFPKHGEWRLYVSPGGYQMVIIMMKKEQAA